MIRIEGRTYGFCQGCGGLCDIQARHCSRCYHNPEVPRDLPSPPISEWIEEPDGVRWRTVGPL